MKKADVAVIGAGVMGAAAAWRLAAKGLSVIVLESRQLLHKEGSSHGRTRILRKAYFENPAYVPMLQKSYKLWDTVQKHSSKPVMRQCGVLYFGPPGCELMAGTARSIEIHGIPHVRLSFEELKARYPLINYSAGDEGIFEPEAGYLYAENAVEAMADRAVGLGAMIYERAEVTGISSTGSMIHIEGETADWEAGSLVLCAGSWTSSLLPDLQLPLKVTRQVVGWLKPAVPSHFFDSKMPVFAGEADGQFLYGIPCEHLSQDALVKVACHAKGAEISPDEPLAGADSVDLAVLKRQSERLFGNRLTEVQQTSVCKYTSTPDGHFILDRHPEMENVWIAAGFSGHGFKFAPVIGDILASWVNQEEVPYDLEFLRLSRFGKPVKEMNQTAPSDDA